MAEQFFIKIDSSGNPLSVDQYNLNSLLVLHPEINTVSDTASFGYAEYSHTPIPLNNNPFQKKVVEVLPTERTGRGEFIQKWEIIDKTFGSAEEAEQARVDYLNQEKFNAKVRIDDKRRTVAKSGFSYTFPDGQTGTVQTRKSVDGYYDDDANLSNLLAQAQILISKNDSSTTIIFRDAENNNHTLTPAQVVAMWEAYQTFLYNQLQWAWGKKAEVSNATTIEQLDAITI